MTVFGHDRERINSVFPVIQDVLHHARFAISVSRSPTGATCAAAYCMPEQDYVWLPREDILRFEEIERLVDVFTSTGVDKVRLTGGEPLLRRDLPDLVDGSRRGPRFATWR